MQRQLRLRRNEDFQRLRHTGQTWAHPLFILSMAPNDLPHNRYGFITTRKLGNAVARNRAKRRLREAARFWHPRLTPGHDVVFIARQGVNDRLFTELIDAMEVLFRRADLL